MMVGRALAIAVCLAPLAASADAPPRFEHARHGALPGWDPELVCTSCHTDARPDRTPPGGPLMHSRCNTEGCHATAFDELEGTICLTCHATKSRLPEEAKARAPFPLSPSFYAELSHRTHLAKLAPARRAAACAGCHSAKDARPDHASCDAAECHGGRSAPPMSVCHGCHRPLFDLAGKSVWTGPRRRRDHCRVTRAFSHASHERYRARCGDCHLGVERATRLGELVATQGGRTMEDGCGRCHDGKRAFSIRGSCERCHLHDCVVEGE